MSAHTILGLSLASQTYFLGLELLKFVLLYEFEVNSINVELPSEMATVVQHIHHLK